MTCSICYETGNKGGVCEDGNHIFCQACIIEFPDKFKDYKCLFDGCQSSMFMSKETNKLLYDFSQTNEKLLEEELETIKKTLCEKISADITESQKNLESHYFKEITQPPNCCPKCKSVFDDYDGCNALKCETCSTAFCGLCLEDCDDDAHDHLNEKHSGIDLYNHTMFHQNTKERQCKMIIAVIKESATITSKLVEQLEIMELPVDEVSIITDLFPKFDVSKIRLECIEYKSFTATLLQEIINTDKAHADEIDRLNKFYQDHIRVERSMHLNQKLKLGEKNLELGKQINSLLEQNKVLHDKYDSPKYTPLVRK
jgi:hypothetical protein